MFKMRNCCQACLFSTPIRHSKFHRDQKSASGRNRILSDTLMSHSDGKFIQTSKPTLSPYLPGSISLLADLDKELLVVLRDNRTLVGFLRTIDQFANLMLHRTVERIYVGTRYGDIPRGIMIIRGENVALIGEVDNHKSLPYQLEKVSVDEILDRQRVETEQKEKIDSARKKALLQRGLCIHREGLLEELY